jgi:hypothetical protein
VRLTEHVEGDLFDERAAAAAGPAQHNVVPTRSGARWDDDRSCHPAGGAGLDDRSWRSWGGAKADTDRAAGAEARPAYSDP